MKILRVYIVLLFICIVMKLFAHLFPFVGNQTVQWILYSDVVYDLIFFSAVGAGIYYLEEKWWIWLAARIAFFSCFVKDVLAAAADRYFSISMDRFFLYMTVLTLPVLVFVVSLFLVRQYQGNFRLLGFLVLLGVPLPLLYFAGFSVPSFINLAGVTAYILRSILLIVILARVLKMQDPDEDVLEAVERIGSEEE
jgi:hypothetical protein